MPPAVPSSTGQAEYGVGPAQRVVIDRGYAGGREAQHEAVERQVMKAAPPQGEARFLRCSLSVSATQVAQRQDVERSPPGRAAT